MVSCTKVRLPALQHCPWLKNSAECACSTATSIFSVSAKTIFGLFPPSSSVTRFKLEFAAAACINLPTLIKKKEGKYLVVCKVNNQMLRNNHGEVKLTISHSQGQRLSTIKTITPVFTTEIT